MRTSPYCKAPWTGLVYEGTVGCKPCCEWKGEAFHDTYTNYIKSDYLKEFKTKMYADEMHLSCIECINVEKRGAVPSRRQKYEHIDVEYSDGIPNLTRLDYRPGNKCNLMCRMCWPGASSLLEEEEKSNPYGSKIMHSVNLDTSDCYDIDLSNVKKLQILGGEPSIDLELRKWINHHKDFDGYIGITTNATNSSDKWFNTLRQLKRLELTLSIDATGSVQEFQRFKSDWKEIKENVYKYKENFKNVIIHLTATAINFPVIDTWWDEMMEFNIPLYFGLVYFPEEYSLDAIPKEYKDYQVAWLRKWIKYVHFHDNYYSAIRQISEAEEAIEILESSEYKETFAVKFKDRVKWHDEKRNQRIEDLDYRFEEIMNE